jgi:hypothetical protein
MTTLAPVSSMASAAQNPTPRPPPVMKAVRPLRSYLFRDIWRFLVRDDNGEAR